MGSITEITIDDLCAEDKDSLPSELIYSITPPSNGHLALKSSPNKSILSFTQAHIIEGQLVFVHDGMWFQKYHICYQNTAPIQHICVCNPLKISL